MTKGDSSQLVKGTVASKSTPPNYAAEVRYNFYRSLAFEGLFGDKNWKIHMSKTTRRQIIQAGIACGAALTAGASTAADEKEHSLSIEDLFFPTRLTKEKIAAGNGVTFTKHEYAGSTFWVGICDFLGGGVPHAWIAIYAPDKEGVFHRCLLAESWTAGNIEGRIDAKAGILEFREVANSTLKGQIVLACNLKTIGTQLSIEGK